MPRRGRMRAPSRSASSPAGAPRGSPTQILEHFLAQKTGAESFCTSFAVLIKTDSLAAICSAAPEKLRFSGFPYLFNPQAGRARLPARKFPAFGRKFCLDAPFGAARFRSQKRPNWTAFSRPASQSRLSPPSARPLFCCGPCRSPRGCRSGPPPRKSAYRGRGPPRR